MEIVRARKTLRQRTIWQSKFLNLEDSWKRKFLELRRLISKKKEILIGMENS